MDGKSLASKGLIAGNSCGFLNLQDSMQIQSHQTPQPSFQGFMVSDTNEPSQDTLLIKNRSMQKSDMPIGFLERYSHADMAKSSCDEDSSYTLAEHVDGNNNEIEKEKKESHWQRVKWTDQMVKLLITAVSYIGEDSGRASSPLPKKGKWKAISKVMAERGFPVSPQQCEDKFNDLNKRYKKLNDILGKGTSCDVVENPALLDLMDVSDKSKDVVKKILSSKQLFYQEMCSYHNGNRLYIPHDQAIQRSLHLALRNSDDLGDYSEAKAYRSGSIIDEEENDASDCPNDNIEERNASNEDLGSKLVSAKRKKPEENEYLDPDYLLNYQNGTKNKNNWFISRSLELEEQKLQIEAEMLELKKHHLRWLKSSELEDEDLEKMRMENECLKLENERLALDIKRRETGGPTN